MYICIYYNLTRVFRLFMSIRLVDLQLVRNIKVFKTNVK